ncbi:hypothetical protein M8J75_004150 [Diaphorina citri]|nr:hypothetical protein M8J75_004150 [Diaphorina citri]
MAVKISHRHFLSPRPSKWDIYRNGGDGMWRCKRKDGNETVMKDNGDKAATDTNGGEDKPSPFSIATAKQVGYLTKWWRWDVEM